MKRKDVNVMCSWVVTAPKDLPAEDNRKFFEETYKFLAARYGGEKNVVSAYVHTDEVTPHMHFAFVPVVADRRKGIEKVSAKECVTRADLQSFHDNLENHLAISFGREIGILNEATREGNKSISELKRGQAVADLENTRKELTAVQDDVKRLHAAKSGLQAKIEGLEGRVLTIKGLEDVHPEKTLTGALRGVSVEQVQDLKKTAMKYHEVKADNTELRKRYAALEQAYKSLEQRVPSLKTQLSQAKTTIELERQLKSARDFIAHIPENVRGQVEQEIKREQSGQEYSWEMSR
jgi:chromosome segregation ATPase